MWLVLRGDVINEIIWNNRLFCNDKICIDRDDMIKLGFLKTADVAVWAKNSSRFNVCRASLLSPEQNFFLMSLIDPFHAEYYALANFFY